MIAGRLFLLLAVTVWGFSFVATKVGLSTMGPLELLSLRFLIGVPTLFVVTRLRRVRLSFPGQHRAIAIGGALITIHFCIQVTGLQWTSATHTGWLIAATPLALAVLARILLGEQIRRRTAAGLAIATLGVLVLAGGEGLPTRESLAGDALILVSAHTWALYTIATRDLSRACPALAVSFAVLALGSLPVLLLTLLGSDGSFLARTGPEGWLAVAFLGLFATAGGHWFWQEGVARVGAVEAAILLYLEPLATTALSVPYLGEPFGLTAAAGGALILAGVAFATAIRPGA